MYFTENFEKDKSIMQFVGNHAHCDGVSGFMSVCYSCDDFTLDKLPVVKTPNVFFLWFLFLISPIYGFIHSFDPLFLKGDKNLFQRKDLRNGEKQVRLSKLFDYDKIKQSYTRYQNKLGLKKVTYNDWMMAVLGRVMKRINDKNGYKDVKKMVSVTPVSIR